MLSIIILFISAIIFFIILRFKSHRGIKITFVVLVNVLLLEIFCYGFFMLTIIKGTCFFLIGNQTTLDTLMKLRLVYATYYSQGKNNFINQLNDDLGYSLGSDKRTPLYQTNYQGFRAAKEYSIIPKSDALRMAAFGDSFVFCDGEKNEDTWPYMLENQAGQLEVLNFGVPGYGLGQSYLRYLKDGLKFKPDILFINYVLTTPRDRINPKEFVGLRNLRMAHFYRVRFWMQDDQLYSKSTTPFDLFDQNFRSEHLYRPLGMDGEPKLWRSWFLSKINTGLFVKQIIIQKTLSQKIKVNPQAQKIDPKINIKILKNLIDTALAQKTEVLFFYQYEFDKLPEDIKKMISQKGVTYVNMTKAFEEQQDKYNLVPGQSIKNSSHHYNAVGNTIYANAVMKVLKSKSWGLGERVFIYSSELNGFVRVLGDGE